MGIIHPSLTEVQCDLSDLEALEGVLERIFPDGRFSRIVLVNNAGMLGEIDYVGTLSAKSIRQIFSLNTIASAVLMNAFVAKYAHHACAEKAVVNISSGAAIKAIDGWAMYSASKAAINAMSETAQKEAEIRKTDIRIFALAPGVVDTEMQEKIRLSDERSFSELKRFKGLKEKNQLSTPQEVAEKILYLLDHMADFQGVIQDVRNF
jgi:benzil reductase ((S)-benzoin forming)